MATINEKLTAMVREIYPKFDQQLELQPVTLRMAAETVRPLIDRKIEVFVGGERATLAVSFSLIVATCILLESAPAPGMVIDPADSDLTGSIPGVVPFSDPRRSTNRKGDNWREAARARFVPTDPDDFDVYSAVYEWCFTHFPRRVWCDEALDVLPVRGYPRGARRYLALGAKRMLGHQACTQRPVEIMRSLVANGEHIFVWSLANPDDVVYVAKYMGVAPAELGALLAQLRPYEFLWFDRRAKTLTVCPPIAPVPSAARGRRGAEIAT